MHCRDAIERAFEGKAFLRPLFYSYPGGLRFELSEPGAPLDQVLSALHKARSICADVFAPPASLTVWLRLRTTANRFEHRKAIDELRTAGIAIPRERSIWVERIEEEGEVDEDQEAWWLNVAFAAPPTLIQNFLWCAFATDFASIRPRPCCGVYLFNLERRVIVFPYDDRGMDVVGPNHDFLATIFHKHRAHLLEYDMRAMLETFGEGNHDGQI